MQTAPKPFRHPWLDRLVADPDAAVDSLLSGVAQLSGLQRASSSEALMALMGDLPDDAPEWDLLDRALYAWLQRRRNDESQSLSRPGGVRRFISETGEALRSVWRLERLPVSAKWIKDNLFDLLRWAETFGVDRSFDLAEAVMAAGAKLQHGAEYRFIWHRICAEAATPRLRHRLAIALLGLSRISTGDPKAGGAIEVVAGFARWASHLPHQDQHKGETVKEWRAIKAAFPRQPGFWRARWDAIREDARNDHPFTGWLKDSDPSLTIKGVGAPKREPLLPKNIQGTIREFRDSVAKDGFTEPPWFRMKIMLDQIERYAEMTGTTYYLVTSCTNIANIILPYSPGNALMLARRALLWAPSDGHAWSVRAKALQSLGREDIAISVLWEGMRRAPSDSAMPDQLARLFFRRGRVLDAEVLLRRCIRLLDDKSGATSKQWEIALFSLGMLLVAQRRIAEASVILERRKSISGTDSWDMTLSRLIASGEAGQQEAEAHLAALEVGAAGHAVVPWDSGAMEQMLLVESEQSKSLEKISRVTEADFLFQSGRDRDRALRLVDEATKDESDVYAHLVKALAVPEYGVALEGKAGRFEGSLPLLLALPGRRWDYLAERFHEGRPLIGLVRLARHEGNDEVRTFLADWTKSPDRWDDSWTDFLKKSVASYLAEDATAVDIGALAHLALTQAVDVNWGVASQAA